MLVTYWKHQSIVWPRRPLKAKFRAPLSTFILAFLPMRPQVLHGQTQSVLAERPSREAGCRLALREMGRTSPDSALM